MKLKCLVLYKVELSENVKGETERGRTGWSFPFPVIAKKLIIEFFSSFVRTFDLFTSFQKKLQLERQFFLCFECHFHVLLSNAMCLFF